MADDITNEEIKEITIDMQERVSDEEQSIYKSEFSTQEDIAFLKRRLTVLENSRPPYGFVEGDHINWTQANAVQNTWYNISDADMVTRFLNAVAHDGSGKMTVKKAGIYQVGFNVAYEVNAANVHMELGIEVNGSGTANATGPHVHTTSKFSNQEQDSGSSALMDLAANATIEVAIRTIDAGTPNFIIDNVHLTCVMVSEI